jgi:hypothetical protein
MYIARRAEEKVLDRRTFYCPKCKASEGYQRIGLSRYGFIDIWFWTVHKYKVEKVGEYVECYGCGNRFEASVLRSDTHKMLSLVAKAASLCRRGTPYNAVRAWLIKMCGSAYIADRVMAIALGEGPAKR